MSDLLIYTVAYAFMDKATRMSTINYKGQGSKLLKVLHMKCASVDENTKLRAKMQFLLCKIGNEETAINFLTRLEQRANETRNYDLRISEKRFLWVLLNNMKHHRYYKERMASFPTAFELNPSIISQRWIENKFYSMDEERMQNQSFRFPRENARHSLSSDNKQRGNFARKSTRGSFSPKNKTLRCKSCYKTGHMILNVNKKKPKDHHQCQIGLVRLFVENAVRGVFYLSTVLQNMKINLIKPKISHITGKVTLLKLQPKPLNLLDQSHILFPVKE